MSNWYRMSQEIDPESQQPLTEDELLKKFALLDTRGRKDRVLANKMIIKFLNIGVGDVLVGVGRCSMSNMKDVHYKVERIFDDGNLALLALESGRLMNEPSGLYCAIDPRHPNSPRWRKA